MISTINCFLKLYRPSKMNNLKIIQWNSKEIPHKKNELYALATKLNHIIYITYIDIIILSETHLKRIFILEIPNYYLYRTNLSSNSCSPAHGGTAVFVHRHITHKSIKLKTNSININNNKIRLHRNTNFFCIKASEHQTRSNRPGNINKGQ